MPKRQHDTNIWGEDWFIQMDAEHREFWFYLKDQCDHAGIWRPNLMNYERVYRTEINVKAFLEQVNNGKDRVVILPNKRWFLTGFMFFQYGNALNPKNQVHKGAIRRVLDYKVPMELINGIINKEVFDYKYVERFKSTISENENIEENNQLIDNQHQQNEAPLEGLPSTYEGAKDKNKDKDKDTSIVYSLKQNIINENSPQIFEITEVFVPLPYSTPMYQMPTVSFMHDNSPLAQEIQIFLSKSNFAHFAMMHHLKPAQLCETITQFVKHVLSNQEFQKANQLLVWLGNWYRSKQGRMSGNGNYNGKPAEILSTEKRDYSQVKGMRDHQKKQE